MPAYALIAEPDPAQAAVYSHLLSTEGIELELVRDGEAARQALAARGAPALIITELSLARTDGFALLAHLRTLATLPQSPAVVISAFRELREAAGRMKDALGISALFGKPAPLEALRREVKRALLSAPAGASKGPRAARAPGPAPLVRPAVAIGGREGARESAQRRLARLRAMGLVEDKGPDPGLQALLDEARVQFGVRAAFVTLALEDHHTVRVHSGLEGRFAQTRSVPLHWTFLRQVLESREVLVVPDAAIHPLFSADPLVQDGTVRGFAAAPLAGPGGEVIGTLGLVEKEPLRLGPAEVDALVQLARRVSGELELRGARARATRPRRPGASGEREPVESAEGAPGPKLAHLTAALDNIDSGLVLVDGERRVVFTNQIFADLIGRTPDELRGLQRGELLSLFAQLFDDPEGFLRQMRVPDVGPYSFREQFELQRPKRMVLRWVGKPVPLENQGGLGHLGILTDITAEADLALEREAQARTDALTGLANRRGGEEALQREVARMERGKSLLSLALFDLDNFKQVNDAFGHPGGDDALRAVARVLLSAVRGADLVVRWGGDELLAILPSTGSEGARSLAERVRARVEALDEPEFGRVTVSAGVTELAPGEDEQQALARADARLYEAKAAGRNCVR